MRTGANGNPDRHYVAGRAANPLSFHLRQPAYYECLYGLGQRNRGEFPHHRRKADFGLGLIARRRGIKQGVELIEVRKDSQAVFYLYGGIVDVDDRYRNGIEVFVRSNLLH